MSNTSATGGYLVPTSGAPLEDDALDDFFHGVVAGITGLANTVVLPRWQTEPPQFPTGDWVAFGIMSRKADTFAYVGHDGDAAAGQGEDTMIRHEELELLCSFYGPNCQAYGAKLRDGLSIAQNREPLFLANMGLMAVGDLLRAPEMLKNKWVPRAELPFWVRREIQRTYPVLNLLSADGSVVSSAGTSNDFHAQP